MSAIQTKGSPPLIILFSYSALGRLTHRSKRNLPCSPSHGSSPRAQERIIDGPARPMVPGSKRSAGSIIKDNFYNVNRVWVWQHDCACKHLEVCRGPIAQVRFRARYILHSVNLYHNLSHLARQSRPFRSRKTCSINSARNRSYSAHKPFTSKKSSEWSVMSCGWSKQFRADARHRIPAGVNLQPTLVNLKVFVE